LIIGAAYRDRDGKLSVSADLDLSPEEAAALAAAFVVWAVRRGASIDDIADMACEFQDQGGEMERVPPPFVVRGGVG